MKKILTYLVLGIALSACQKDETGAARDPVDSVKRESVFVGNGGEGIVTDGGLYLLDLVATGIHRNPVFGEEINPYVARRVNETLPPVLSVDRDLLARKLTDLDRLHPFFSAYILTAIRAYQWVLTDAPLHPPRDAGTVTNFNQKDARRIATRYRDLITIHRQQWELLNQQNRVAFILHEAIYSLIKPNCDDNDLCQQRAADVISVMGLLFSGSTGEQYKLKPHMEEKLFPKNSRLSCPGMDIRRDYHVEVRLPHPTPPRNWYTKVFFLTDASDPATRKEFHQTLCKAQDQFVPGGTKITVVRFRDPFKAELVSYRTSSGESLYDQFYLEFWPQKSFDFYSIQFRDTIYGEYCVENLEASANDWYTGRLFFLPDERAFTGHYRCPDEDDLREHPVGTPWFTEFPF